MTTENLQLLALIGFILLVALVAHTIIDVVRSLSKNEDEEV
jgi:hypothetical protein